MINEELTLVETQFVDALSDASRMTYRVLRAIMFDATPGLILFGIVLTLRVLRHRRLTEDRVNYICQYYSPTMNVHTADRLAFLRAQRCNVAQGFFLYRPLAENEVAGRG